MCKNQHKICLNSASDKEGAQFDKHTGWSGFFSVIKPTRLKSWTSVKVNTGRFAKGDKTNRLENINIYFQTLVTTFPETNTNKEQSQKWYLQDGKRHLIIYRIFELLFYDFF